MTTRLLKHIINSDKRDYIIEQVNRPLAKTIIMLGGRYDEPTHENVLHPNSHRLLDIKDEFFRCWNLGSSKPLFEALWRTLTVKYEHSPNWRNFLDWGWMMLEKSGWKPWNPTRQMPLWRGE